MTIAELHEFILVQFPQVAGDFKIEGLGDGYARVRMLIGERNLRPGGTVSGPAMFSLADVSVYVCILSMIGPKALAVTTSCSMDFMRKPAARDLLAETRMLKLGKRLAVGDVLIHSEGQPKPVARATMTYSIPVASG